jgi:hypothetical protein
MAIAGKTDVSVPYTPSRGQLYGVQLVYENESRPLFLFVFTGRSGVRAPRYGSSFWAPLTRIKWRAPVRCVAGFVSKAHALPEFWSIDMPKPEKLTLVLETARRNYLAEWAREEGRPVGNLLRRIVDKACEQRQQQHAGARDQSAQAA